VHAAELMALAVREFGITIDHCALLADARSGAGVHPARTPGGQRAYLKITPAGMGAGGLDGARREVRSTVGSRLKCRSGHRPCSGTLRPAPASLCC
jgi:hypothetical protein